MSKINLLLLAALIASALLLVKTSYESRRVFAQLDRARAEQQGLEAERQRLEAERQAQAAPLRVEQVARNKLEMRNATAAVTQYVNDRAASGSVPGVVR
ncbi:MAG: cell division protein FtsL [Rubrivivax sp.]|nr:cell division protein FtsL [Rubrivivax sp.]